MIIPESQNIMVFNRFLRIFRERQGRARAIQSENSIKILELDRAQPIMSKVNTAVIRKWTTIAKELKAKTQDPLIREPPQWFWNTEFYKTAYETFALYQRPITRSWP